MNESIFKVKIAEKVQKGADSGNNCIAPVWVKKENERLDPNLLKKLKELDPIAVGDMGDYYLVHVPFPVDTVLTVKNSRCNNFYEVNNRAFPLPTPLGGDNYIAKDFWEIIK